MRKVEEGRFREDLYYRLSTVPIFVPPLRERENDIDLLFRKFASDFAEKYHVKPITLTDDAKQVLLKYRFPGNIRQLKNIVEQISVLTTEEKEIDGIMLQRYIPRDSNLPAVIAHGGHERDSVSERDILYKVLFDMKRDMVDLKKLVLDIYNNQGKASQLVKDHPELFEGIESDNRHTPEKAVLLNVGPNGDNDDNESIEEIHDITHETEDESLSIEKKEKELIVRALRKNNNKRKYAARDLGISERTLYRKIKQYELE
jgi:DNA-binding NtrC family response regulator